MSQRSLSATITVSIGHYARTYFAYVTSAPVALDSPATLTLYEASLADVAGFAAEPITLDPSRSRQPARLVLIDAVELAWQRAKTKARGHNYTFLPADPVLVGLNTLQHWLWLRLQAAPASRAAA